MSESKNSTFPIIQHAFLDDFQCLGADCEDTCCIGWGMQVEPAHKQFLEKNAPELLENLTTGESEIIMKRDPETDYCVKFEDGICSIHKKYGSDFIGDACHFYPRISRKIGEKVFLTAALSCPEVTNLMLFGKDPFALQHTEIDRLPTNIKQYAENADGDTTIEFMQNILGVAGDESLTPQRALSIILTICKSLGVQPEEKWPEAFTTYRKMAEKLLINAESHFADGIRLVNILVALIEATKKSDRHRLNETVATMEQALNIRINRDNMEIVSYGGNNEDSYAQLEEKWKQGAEEKMAPVLRRWLQAEIALNNFPYSGFGDDMEQRRIVLAVRFATVRLALMSHMDEDGNPPDEDTIIRIVQSLARFLDHLADPTFSMMAYTECGWTLDARLRSLIGDN